MTMTTGELGRRLYTSVDLALFAAATWNPHLIHLSPQAAADDGLPGIVVQSHFLPATLLALLDQSGQTRGKRLRAVSWRNRAVVQPGEVVVFSLGDADSTGTWSWSATVAGRIVADGSLRIVHGVSDTQPDTDGKQSGGSA